MRDVHFVIAKNRRDHGGRHASFFAGGLEEFRGSSVKDLSETFDGWNLRFGFSKNINRGLGRGAAGDVAIADAAHAVGKNGDAADSLALIKILRLPKNNEVFVVVAHGS